MMLRMPCTALLPGQQPRNTHASARTLSHTLAAAAAACSLSLGLPHAALASSVEEYERLTRPDTTLEAGRARGTPNVQAYKSDLFTDDAWQGMLELQEYARLIDAHEGQEAACGDRCVGNRHYVEESWQTVSNDFFDPKGKFSQAAWSAQLKEAMTQQGGVIYTREEAHEVVRRMMMSLDDKYSMWLPDDEYRKATSKPTEVERQYMDAQRSGAGLELGAPSADGGYIVVAPLPGSPAEEAGIVAGDRLLAIDDVPVGPGITLDGYKDADGVGADVVTGLLRGPSGTPVKLTLATRGDTNVSIRRVTVERRYLPRPPVRTRRLETAEGGSVQVVRVYYFTSEARRMFEAAIRQGEAAGVDGYIIDMRNNPGGVFEESVTMAVSLLDDACDAEAGDDGPWSGETAHNGAAGARCGDIASTVRSWDDTGAPVVDVTFNAAGLPRDIFFSRPHNLTHAPVAVLVNQGTASAAEVLAGALHDHRRALLVGSQTFGKGVIQYFYPILVKDAGQYSGRDGSGLKLTVAKYLTPAQHDIARDGGLMPDVRCDDHPRGELALDACMEQAAAYVTSHARQREPAAPPPPNARSRDV